MSFYRLLYNLHKYHQYSWNDLYDMHPYELDAVVSFIEQDANEEK